MRPRQFTAEPRRGAIQAEPGRRRREGPMRQAKRHRAGAAATATVVAAAAARARPSRSRKLVALLVETSNAYARGLLHGVIRYVREHRPWSTYLAEHGRG